MQEFGISFWPSDWTAQCEALCRKTGKQCPHTCSALIPSILGSFDGSVVSGRPVQLCHSHHMSFLSRVKRMLSLPLIEGGHLSCYNRQAFGATVVKDDRLDLSTTPVKVRLAHRWGWISYKGDISKEQLERIPRFLDFKDAGMVEAAKQIAVHAHAGQTRRDKVTPYIRHCEDVVSRVAGDPLAEAVAWLHDVLEDTTVRSWHLRHAMIYAEVIRAVELLTKREGMDYGRYLELVAGNELARKVKIADMLSNLSDDPTDRQIKKYREGLKMLNYESDEIL